MELSIGVIFIFVFIFVFRVLYIYEKICEYNLLSNVISPSDLKEIREGLSTLSIFIGSFAIIYIPGFIIYFLYNFQYNVHKLFYWKNLIIVVFFILVFESIIIYFKHKEDFKNYKRVQNLMTIRDKVQTSTECLENEIRDIKKDKMIDETTKEEQIKTLEDTIVMLKKIYGEISFSLEVVLVNDAISNVKDVEMNSADLDSLQKQIDKFESYKSLSDISSELKTLMKKYDKK